MNKSSRILAAAAVAGFAMIVAGLIAAPFNTSASAAAGQSSGDVVSERIGATFASLTDVQPASALHQAASRAAKGDLFAARDCAGSVWPDISADCLATTDGSPAPAVRFITMGHQEGDATTILVRMPAAAIAAR